MRFVDASVFVHAFLKPRRQLSPGERGIKARAKGIVSRVNAGENVLTSVVHVAEVANILEDYISGEEARAVEEAILFKDSIVAAPVSRETCFAALQGAREMRVGLSDAVAYTVMKASGIDEVYSFDRDFDRMGELRRISE